jgi:ribonuclease P protein component
VSVAQSLSRDEHIRKRRDFQQVYQQGARMQGRYMTLFFLSTERPVARLGVSATRKFGGAVQRNRAKRLIREVFRRHKPASGMDLVIIPRANLADAPFASLEADYRHAMGRRPTLRVRA